MRNLLLTLGHNSSAIVIEDGRVVCGYETERITGVKSDSRFPMSAIERLIGTSFDATYVTHWSPTGHLSDMSAKHWDPSYFDGTPVITHKPEITHHDTHMYGAIAYAGVAFPKGADSYGLVIDGFGSYGEHISIYKLEQARPVLVKRYHGYGTSLGLWYQYATAFMNLKMHEDEYKLLGYEVHVKPQDFDRLVTDADIKASEWLEELNQSVYGSKYDPLYSISALHDVKQKIYTHLLQICNKYNITDTTTTEARAILACYVQMVLEKVVLSIVDYYRMDNVLLSGGVFYNVKLNKLIVDKVRGSTCIYPLAGDQGNALGLYKYHNPEFVFPDTLNWGVRKLYDVGHVPGLYVVDESTAMDIVIDKLGLYGYVNLVRGSMEFGPRAMCNTSTLAIPRKEIVDKINKANDRNTVMPMAPVMTSAMYESLFHNTRKLFKSQSHMICAMEFIDPPGDALSGISHEYSYPRLHYTGRPQVVHHNDLFMRTILKFIGMPLINTSFNYHGQPIAYDMLSIISNHMAQRKKDQSFTTVVIKND